MFRALGHRDPPSTIELLGQSYRRVDMLKHDSWAATAVYANDAAERVACKFNRTNPLFIIPMAWLGRYLAQREQYVLDLMSGLEGFPHCPGAVYSKGRILPNAVAHDWIEAQTFKPWLEVDDQFFPRLRAMLAELHSRDIAYVDMSKWENILVGDDGRPYLLDYQIHIRIRGHWPPQWWLRLFQNADLYFLYRQWVRCRPDQLSPEDQDLRKRQPYFIRLCEALGPAWRAFRRLVLRLFGVAPRRDIESRK